MPNTRLYIVAVILCVQGGLVKAADSKLNSQTEANFGYLGSAPAHGSRHADKPDSSHAIEMLSDEMKKVMDLENDADSAHKFIPIFPMMTLTRSEYEPAPGGIINPNYQANMARLTDVLHVDPLGGGISDPGDYRYKLSIFANKVLENARPVDPDAIRKVLRCFETEADQIVNDEELSRKIKSIVASCAEENVQGRKQYDAKFVKASEDCYDKIAGNAHAQVEDSRSNCFAEAKKVTREFQKQVAYSMDTCQNLVRVHNWAFEVIRSRCNADAAAIGTKLAKIGKYRDQLHLNKLRQLALNEQDGYSESWARSSTRPDTIHPWFMDAPELDARGIVGGPDAGWTRVTKTFEKSETETSEILSSRSSLSVTASGSFCYMGIVCVKASLGHSKEDAQADLRNMKLFVSFKTRPLEITHSWFPFDILNDETFLSEARAQHSWHVPYQWDQGAGWGKKREGQSPLLAYRSKIIFCKDIRVSIASRSSEAMRTIRRTKVGDDVGVTLPMFGSKVRTDMEKVNEESYKKEQQGGIHLIGDGVGICGYVLTQLSSKKLPINDGTGDDDEGRKKEMKLQKARFDVVMEKLKKLNDEELKKQGDLDPTWSAYSGNKAEL